MKKFLILNDTTLENYKEEIEIKLTNERFIVSNWIQELNKPSIIAPRRKPVSNTKKKFI